MKRSRTIRLALMGSAAFALAACNDEPVPGGAFQSADQCRTDGRFSAAACDEAFSTAQQRHLVEAPRYDRREDCEAGHGASACEVLPGHLARSADGTVPTADRSGSFFIPYMTGFLIGQLAGQQTLARPLYSAGPSAKPNAAGLRTGDGNRIAAAPGPVSVQRNVLTASPRVTRASAPVVSRGGFGSSGRSSSTAS